MRQAAAAARSVFCRVAVLTHVLEQKVVEDERDYGADYAVEDDAALGADVEEEGERLLLGRLTLRAAQRRHALRLVEGAQGR